MAKDSGSHVCSRKHEGLKIRPRLFQIDRRVSNWSSFTESYRSGSYCLVEFSKICLPHPSTKASLTVFANFQSCFPTWKLGVHVAMSTDGRFLPEGKQILPKIYILPFHGKWKLFPYEYTTKDISELEF